MKKLIFIMLILSMIVLTGCGHIEDTNGEDDFSLETISGDDMINNSSSASTVSFTKTVGNKTEVSIKKFSGVKSIYKKYSAEGEYKFDFDVKCNSGNLAVVLVYDDEIVKTIPVNETSSFSYSFDGTFEVKIAGESANLEITFVIEK